MTTELWSIRRIAREYGVDHTTARWWTQRDWFPEPVENRGGSAGTLYDPAAIRKAINGYNRRRPTNPTTGRRRNA